MDEKMIVFLHAYAASLAGILIGYLIRNSGYNWETLPGRAMRSKGQFWMDVGAPGQFWMLRLPALFQKHTNWIPYQYQLLHRPRIGHILHYRKCYARVSILRMQFEKNLSNRYK
ncbi:hypothetical protein SUGI_1030260 [Cryptomeria japonica]|nr:hypothetical protein SUGI_1030260 [Cryptomeria japonica]